MKKLILETFGVTVGLLGLFKIFQFFLSEFWVGILVPALLLYVPFFVLPDKVHPFDFFDRSWKQLQLSFIVFGVAVLIVFPPFAFLAHFWMLWFEHKHGFEPASFVFFTEPLLLNLLVVALPEEFYFRGFLQSRFNQLWPAKWRLLGAELGWGWIVTAVIFAFAHSVLNLQWWHFSIFFPALLFGYLRERTNSLTAPILFHTFSNCFMNWFAKSYF
ncbi:MAG: hypothetical protein A3F82_04570 [Deltaproteobacteria bacterium RIFCSPLOWO2_12_FULL_44_12]|nr:MAG: hypothetical protein A2712_07885 [Deltaproteobacteria bacterium RIFCSPHIGHO2_01_FULL_43_49]OGQ14740.1 MAG: hypothetical protein A3D22_09110 [Deltaproteobacteria bacterium RIFCSPHIGHO2_02_FULL_44_53]OGQ28126.1 MAG: hypothetical protein A3D98_07820 [Deltaproteobacteria bacterium RIFCSPHIGHO2_12_FULL_44_21]OGQ31338.1 MAG: hypothetical protein A2979_07870 [Deltaproteobacteria bacterium RIFCSPLOWO2_01_FULL_45_74]OGQ43330.1 MAG: hypothetical protein A3I70_01530 [Deltaproteobacteria bacterium 